MASHYLHGSADAPCQGALRQYILGILVRNKHNPFSQLLQCCSYGNSTDRPIGLAYAGILDYKPRNYKNSVSRNKASGCFFKLTFQKSILHSSIAKIGFQDIFQSFKIALMHTLRSLSKNQKTQHNDCYLGLIYSCIPV
ncbi:hypothetical protein SDC9_199409 [bioreactor metagenome]|uniref:Uncharacterized protein n=1 Tax=bioreactor metagenome TaxID=1076179 RepID=A0A645IKY7_9ZZZZ